MAEIATREFAEGVLAGVGFFGNIVEPDHALDGFALGEEEVVFAIGIENQ